jgi:hypothetical protein
MKKLKFKIVNKREAPLKKQYSPEFEEAVDKLIKSLSLTLEVGDVTKWEQEIKQKSSQFLRKLPENVLQRDLSNFGIRKKQNKGNQKRLNEEIWLYIEHNLPPLSLLKNSSR